MKKIIAIISSLSGFLVLATPSFADTVNICNDPANQFYKLCGFSSASFGPILSQLLTLIFVVSIVAALFYLVWGGFKWLTSGGDKTAVAAAREHIVAAIIGLIVIFLSYFILNILVHFFTGVDVSKLTIPTIGVPASSTCIARGNACGGTRGTNCCGTSTCSPSGSPPTYTCR